MSSNIAHVIRSWALREPDRPALVLAREPRRVVSYGELDERARRVAALFSERGLAPGDRIALSAPNGLGFVDAWFGGLYAGCTMLPVPPMSSASELAQRIQHARCKALVSDRVMLAAGGLAHDALARCPNVQSFDVDLLAQHERAVSVPQAVPSSQLAMLLYTSGTTGSAKGAMITHGSLGLHTAAIVHHVLRFDGSERVLACLPLTHSYGIRMTLLAPFYAGACAVLVERFQVAHVRALLEREGIHWFPGVPTMFHALAHDAGAPLTVPSLRWCLSAGAPLPREIRLRAEAQIGAPVRQGFGLTEATFSSIATPDDAGADDSVGRAVFGVELRIVDAQGTAVPSGTPGEVCVRGQNVMAGYLDDTESTAAALRDGWLHSGDVGVLDAAGRLTIVDRIKDMVIRGGFNVYPAEVEAVLVQHPAVRDAVVVGVPSERYGEEVLAALVLQPDAPFDAGELANFCRQELSRVKLPRLFVCLDALPVGPSGKVLRRAVRERALSGELALQPLPYPAR